MYFIICPPFVLKVSFSKVHFLKKKKKKEISVLLNRTSFPLIFLQSHILISTIKVHESVHDPFHVTLFVVGLDISYQKLLKK